MERSARLATALLAAALLLSPAAASAQPRMPPSSPSTAEGGPVDRFLKGAARVFTHMDGPVGLVFLPAISANPNSGVTYGVLPVAILTNPRHEVEHIIAPMVNYNQLFGPAFLGTYYWYPSADANFRAVLQKAQKVNGRAALRYEDRAFLGDRCLIRVDTNLEEDGTPRFFGVGPASPKSGESSYRLKEGLAQADFGVKFRHGLEASAGWRFRRAETLPGTVAAPAAFDPARLETAGYSMPRLTFSRDTRDLGSTPSQGSFAELFTEFSRQALGSDSSFQRYGGQWRLYLPHSDGHGTAFHLQGEYSDGRAIPFTALASLGGPRSLRGYPEGRFQDRGSVFGNIEERFTFHRLSVVNAVTEFQVAPFVDVGTVFPSPDRLEVKHLEPVVGAAFRAVVKPTVVGRVETGVSREGPAVYMGIDYPF
ncbi:MAG: BamA/TamA family outer membrane protein [Elusimicrobia bacterium]|nr:BamA/TamA family outer membrane protein [Elusimicrobiota bacterium]